MEKEGMGVKVGDLMTRNYVWVSPGANLQDSAKTMCKKRVGSLIIQDRGELKGILTEKDILWAVVKKSGKGLEEIKVEDLMKRKVVTIKPSADILEALRKFRKKKVRRLPVTEGKKVIGMLTMKDVLKVDPALFGMVSEMHKIREESVKLKRRRKAMIEGICEECGEQDLLYNVGGQWLCDRCFSKR
jgi:signal-transduction protein with cAMP-binding, CBS, and nucleotidyltransferase domain